jgi:hypothetical protein
LQLAKLIADSELAPKDYRGKPGNVLIAVQMGQEVGLSPMAAIQSIAVINGKPSLYGDVGKAILLSNGLTIDEDDIETIKKTGIARCKITRKGHPPCERTFSIENAKIASLWGKAGPWTQYPERQLAWRAFWFSARDVASDLLKGLSGLEEVQDFQPEIDVTPAKTADTPSEPAARPILDGGTFKLISDKYKQSVVDGKKTVADFIAWVENKGSDMTEDQKKEVNSWVNSGPTTVEGESSKVDDSFVTEMEAAEGSQ